MDMPLLGMRLGRRNGARHERGRRRQVLVPDSPAGRFTVTLSLRPLDSGSAETPAYLNRRICRSRASHGSGFPPSTIEEKIGMIASRQEAVPRLGVPEYHIGGEAAHGLVTKDGPPRRFPRRSGLACGWTRASFPHRHGVGDEARHLFIEDAEV